MSAFVVNLTPTRIKLNKKQNENKEPTDVVMAPFSAKATVTFEGVPVTKTARRVLKIINPSDEEIQVMFTKMLPSDYSITLEWTENNIPAHNHKTLDLTWNPQYEIASKEIIQITDSRNFRKEVTIIMKSIQKHKQSVKRYPTLSSGGSTSGPTRTLKLKSPTGAGGGNKHSILSKQRKRQNLAQTPPTRKIQDTKFSVKPFLEKKHSFDELPSFSLSFSTPCAQMKYSKNKENLSPVTPNRNASAIFDQIKLTPATVTITKSNSTIEYLASLPTPVHNILRPSNVCSFKFSPVEKIPLKFSPDFYQSKKGTENSKSSIQRNALSEITHNAQGYFQFGRDPSPSRTFLQTSYNENTSSAEKDIFHAQTINKTYELKSTDKSPVSFSDSLDEKIFQNCETELIPAISTSSSRLSIIQEETGAQSLQKTFEVTPYISHMNLKRDVELVGTPLRKYSESMRDLSENNTPQVSYAIQGSMPNLNNMSRIQSIEQNRYYNNSKQEKNQSPNNRNQGKVKASPHYQSPNISYNTSVNDVMFNQNEILAASSRFNLHETGKRIHDRQKSPRIIKHEPKTPNTNFQKRLREIDSPFCSGLLGPPENNVFIISPPKRVKIESPNNSDISYRSKNWNRIEIKKVRLQNTLSLTRKPITPRKIKYEPRQPLCETNLRVQQYINPDPFAATTIIDPFLSSYIYLDDRAIDKYESQMKKCLNALVTIPAEFDPDCDTKLDVGRIFNEVRNKELILAPTKEEQSMTYLTKARMETLRAAAYRLYMSNEMSEICSKVVVYIKKSAIKIRQDRNLHLDVVMQRNILELLLCFNPLWLRIGLEVVFNEVIHLHSNADIVGLSIFILNRLFKDKYLERKYSKAFTFSENYSEHIKSYSLQKFLLLLLFLDKAKNNRIIKHNPCLFVKNSKYKETKEILLRFSSELLASVGDITKDLRRLGYSLSHKQIYLDEFDYAFKNLATDLRDGVRLTRVMEIILLRDDLTKQLRCPAISRLQRIFNVNLGLKALANADFDVGNICAGDIVDGHREKTMSLLWQIIYKFRAPKFIAAATVVQKWWRNSWLKVSVRRRILFKEKQRQNAAAVVIQSIFRGYISRRYSRIYKFERQNATIILQKYVRGFLARRKLANQLKSIRKIQCWYKLHKIGQVERKNFVAIRKSVVLIKCWYKRLILARKIVLAATIIHETKVQAKIYHEKACVIQRSIKSYIIHRKLKSIVIEIVNYQKTSKIEYKSAARIQSYLKMIPVRKQFVATRKSTVKIQKYWRSYKLTRILRAQFLGRVAAVIAIQQYFRSYKLMQNERNSFLTLKSTVEKVQSIYRANTLYKIQRAKYVKMKASAIVIQLHFKATLQMKMIRSEYLNILKYTIITQRKFRANRLMRSQQEKYLKLKSATILIQQKFRALQLMRPQYEKFKQLRTSSIIIQQKLRATILAKIIRFNFIQMKFNTILIQQRFRANCLMRKERAGFLELKKATMYVQETYKKNSLMKLKQKEYLNLKQTCVCIQQKFRANQMMQIQRFEFLKLKQSVIIIQQQYRALVLMRTIRSEFIINVKSAKVLQQQYRSIKAMRKQRTEYCQLKSTTVYIQRLFRANLQMKLERTNYVKLRTAAMIIQERYRAFCAMRNQHTNYVNLKQASVSIQQRYRANKLMQKLRYDYVLKRNAVILIQRLFRANLQMKLERTNYVKLRTAAMIIQERFRAFCAMRNQHTNYVNLKKASVTIQQRYRANKLMQRLRNDYVLKRNAVILIQRLFRANLQMKLERTNYVKLRTATMIIQERYRALCAMRNQHTNYVNLKQASVTIQQRYRANKLMQKLRYDYVLKRNAVILIQRLFRANIQMKLERTNYVKLRTAAMIIQERYRAFCAMRNQHTNYVNLKQASLTIQQRYRANKLMQKLRNEYVLKRNAVILIQRLFRANLQMKLERTNYVKLRTATMIIQERYRALCAMRNQHTNYVNLKKASVTIQQRYRANKLMQKLRNDYVLKRNAVILIQRLFRANLQMKLERTNYVKLRTATMIIQERYRAICAMRNQHTNYVNLKQASVTIQQRYRANKLMQKLRNDYVLKRNAVILIQRKFIAHKLQLKASEEYFCIRKNVIKIQRCLKGFILMKTQRKCFLQQKESAIKIQKWFRSMKLMWASRSEFSLKLKSVNIIQRRWRATLKMQLENQQFLKIKAATTIIQQKYRNYIQMRTQRSEFLQLKKSVIIIQQRFRANRDMLKLRNQYLLIRSLTICLQRRFRAARLMKIDRTQYLKLKWATILCQQIYSAKLKMRIKRKTFINLKNCALGLQQFGRGYLARKNFNARITPEMKQLFRQKKAAKVIQKYWRGYRVRQKWSNLRIVVIREKLRDLKSTASACNSLRYKIVTSIKLLKGRFNVQEALGTLSRFDNLSRTVPHLLMQHSSFISTFCYGIMAQAIRSEADKHIIELCSRIILNLARYNSTTANTFQESGLVTVAQMLLRWCDKDCGIFNTLCTLIWVFAQCPIKNKKIRAFMINTEAIYMLRETKKLLLRKENMKQNVRKLSFVTSNTHKIFPPKTLPSLLPDFGVIHTKPYTFVSSVYGFNVIIAKLGINF